MLNTVILLIAISKSEPKLVSMYGTEVACVKAAKEQVLRDPERSYQCKPFKFRSGYVKDEGARR